MSYFVLEDFRIGLDRRKHMLTLPPGALYECRNAHITRGGEVERKKSLVAKFNLPAGTYGLATLNGQPYVFGSAAAPGGMPGGITYQRLQHPSGIAMSEVVWTSIANGKLYVIAAFGGGVIAHFYDGALVSDWSSGTVSGSMANNSDIASYFASIISTDAHYGAGAAGSVVTVTGLPGAAFTITTAAINGGAVNDQYAIPSTVQAAVAATPEALSKGTLTVAGAVNGNQVSSVKVNGVEILSATITKAGTDNSFASAIAAQINAFVSVPDYTASVVGGIVTIAAGPGTGTGPNGFVVARTITGVAGTIVAANMAGGTAAVAGIAQISTVTFGGTFEAGDLFTVTLGGVNFGGARGGQVGTVAIPLGQKMYTIAGGSLFGAALGTPSDWQGVGSFVTDASSEAAGTEHLTALGIYLNKLVLFAQNAIQIWNVDANPDNNSLSQALPNIGCIAPKTALGFGDSDVFFLANSGLRSLRVRDNTLSAALSDIGSPVDLLIIQAIKDAGATAAKATAIIDPIDGRYLLHIGSTTYAFSFFPNGKVSAWSTYDTGIAITDFALYGQQVLARSRDVVYLLGGDSNSVYGDGATQIRIPFLSAKSIATAKHFTGFDIVCDGEWQVFMGTDPTQPDLDEELCIVSGSTIGLGAVLAQSESPMFSLRLVSVGDAYGKVAALVLHYEPMGA